MLQMLLVFAQLIVAIVPPQELRNDCHAALATLGAREQVNLLQQTNTRSRDVNQVVQQSTVCNLSLVAVQQTGKRVDEPVLERSALFSFAVWIATEIAAHPPTHKTASQTDCRVVSQVQLADFRGWLERMSGG